ncbi:MAG: hypothetical protein K0Q47_66 [Sedimentibacter sp.]|jgi:hypothetical protein|nr:hypothetical protein [Sedimentibacter sp.]
MTPHDKEKMLLKAKNVKACDLVLDTLDLDESKEIIKLLLSRINLFNIANDISNKRVALNHTAIELEGLPYPEEIMGLVRQALGVPEDDDSKDERIKKMTKHNVFRKILQWEGIVGYEFYIKSWIEQIWNISFDSLEVSDER